MTNKIHVPIDTFDQIKGTSGEQVSKPSWDAQDGWSRKRQIEQARLEAAAEQQRQQEAALPVNVELARLSGAVADLQKRLKILELKSDG